MPPPACTYATPSRSSTVRIVMQVSTLPERSKNPTAPAYGPRRSGSSSAMISIARIFGAPETVPAGNAERSAS